MNANSPNSLRRAAVLLGALDRDLAESVVDRLPSGHAALVRQLLDKLGPVSSDEQDQTIVEFLQVSPAPTSATVQRDGVELSLESTSSLGSTPAARGHDRFADQRVNGALPGDRRRNAKPAMSSPFDFRHEQDFIALAAMLEHERPQTVAVCLSQLTEHQLGQVVTLLPDDLRHEALARLPQLDQLDSLVVEAILTHLRGWARNYETHRAARPAPATFPTQSPDSAAASRAPTANRQDEPDRPDRAAPPDPPAAAKTLVTGGEPSSAGSPASSDQASARPFEFHDLARLQPHELMAVLRDIGADVVVLALAASEPMMFQAVAQLLPTAEVEKLRQEITNLGPTAIRDVDRAQRMMTEAAIRLGFTP